MCLDTTWIEPKVAEKDISCWIVVEKDRSRWLSFYQGVRITNKMRAHLETCRTHVGEGLHSFAKYADACCFKREYLKIYNTAQVTILKCVIPKGALYYQGTFDSVWNNCIPVPSYASNRRNLVKPIESIQ